MLHGIFAVEEEQTTVYKQRISPGIVVGTPQLLYLRAGIG